MKAMIFAAGTGSRLKPLTDHTPKALIPIGGKLMLEHVILKLKSSGFDQIVINIHHLGNQIVDFLEANNALPIYSVQRIAGDNEPYQVEFSSTLTIHSVSGQRLKFLIRTRGELVRTTPQFPENVTGFFFSQFLQQIIRIEQPLKQ